MKPQDNLKTSKVKMSAIVVDLKQLKDEMDIKYELGIIFT